MNADYRSSENGLKLTNDEIKKAAICYLDGNSLRAVAKAFNVSHVTLRSYFVDVLPSLDSLLSNEVKAALTDNAPMSIKKEEVVDRVLKSYHMFVNNHLSIMEISKHFNVSFFTTYRDLDRRLFLLHVAAPEFVSIEMVNNVRELMKTHRLDNLTPGSTAYVDENRENGRFAR